ncbi:MAG: hypothetical protein GAK29_01475 [Acinetobacter bereziniae]|uniref:Uncharacterized protein n=1 Tax=Acinetobacter bereziniae TaxID=106648 RepID=A0A833TZI8_ACIBZ|nr:MAG: hypothetical protein GAK29_01475 [Acinetobacter bereziniae]
MNLNLLLDAKAEAERFIKSIDDEIDKQNKDAKKYSWIKSTIDRGYLYSGAGVATIKRRSMDLTRSLSKMRQGK